MKKIIFITTLFILSFLMPDISKGCGPTSPSTIFSYRYHPDLPLKNYLQGRVGIVGHDYSNSYLYAAYRNLIGTGFNEKEQQEIMKRWDPFPGISSESINGDNENWIGARKKVPGTSEIRYINTNRSEEKNGFYLWYANCLADAFATAAKTLEERIAKFGAESVEVKEWLKGQDIVFSNCSEGENNSSLKNIPFPIEGKMHPLIKADRAYQIAAAYFYSGNFDPAGKLFREIANDQSSPWNKISRYLVARSLVRKASLNTGAGMNDKQILSLAKAELTQILADSNLKEIHDISKDMLNLVETRMAPEQKLKSLAENLLKKDNADDLYSDLDSYTYLLNQFSTVPADDMTDWIRHFTADNIEYSFNKWKETHSLPWLVAALLNTKSDHPEIGSLLKEAEKIAPSSPVYPMVTYHSIRLLIESGKLDNARNRLDTILPELRQSLPLSSLNYFLAQRMSIAKNLDEFLTFAQRTPVGVFYDESGRETPYEGQEFEKELMKLKGTYLFDKDSVDILNESLPVSLLKDISNNDILPVHLRKEIAVAAWTRAVLLNDYKTVKELSSNIIKYLSEENENFKKYQETKNVSERSFTSAYILLKYPGMRPYIFAGAGRLTPVDKIDSFRENWWCPRRSKVFQYPLFLSNEQIETASHESALLKKTNPAPNYLSKNIIEWAKKHPKDPRVPEALHLAVRSTRYGCGDKETSVYSKQAFQLLHKKYPESEWTKKTPFWF